MNKWMWIAAVSLGWTMGCDSQPAPAPTAQHPTPPSGSVSGSDGRDLGTPKTRAWLQNLKGKCAKGDQKSCDQITVYLDGQCKGGNQGACRELSGGGVRAKVKTRQVSNAMWKKCKDGDQAACAKIKERPAASAPTAASTATATTAATAVTK